MLLADLYQFVVALLGLAVESVGVELRIVVIWLSEGDSHQLRLVTIRVIRLTHLLLVRMQLLFLLLGSWIYSLLNEIPKPILRIECDPRVGLWLVLFSCILFMCWLFLY